MRRIQALALSTVSFAAIGIALTPTAASAQQSPGTSQDRTAGQPAPDCAALPTEAERTACEADRAPAEQAGEVGMDPQRDGAQQGQDIVITGSRIRRSEFTTPDPVSIISPEMALQEGDVDTADVIQQSPLAAGSFQITSVISSNFVTNGGGGASTVSLRGLGAERTLVLLNGRRAGPAGTRGAVGSFDLNVLPSSVIQSVEILKSGASSIYGSDAIAGVVNLITRRNTDGIEVRGFVSVPEESGGETYNVNATWGTTFDRGHILVAADYFRRNELARNDRDFLNCSEEYLFSPTGERKDLRDPRTGEIVCQGSIYGLAFVSNLTGTPSNLFTNPGNQGFSIIQLNQTGDRLNEFLPGIRARTSPFQFADFSGTFFPVNFSGPSTALLRQYSPLEQTDSVYPSLERMTLFATGAFEITPNIEIYAEGLFNRRETYTNGSRQLFFNQFTGNVGIGNLSVATCNALRGVDQAPFCAGGIGDPFNTEFAGAQAIQPVGITDHFDFSQQVDYYRGVVGLRGSFGSWLPDWTWDLHGQYSRSDGDYTTDVTFNDAIEVARYRTRTCAGTTTRIRGVPCVDIDWLDPNVLNGNFTQQQRDFLFGEETGNTIYEQKSAEFITTGTLFTLPAGELAIALGVHARKDEIVDSPGAATQSGNAFGVTTAGVTAGNQVTTEAFGEIEIPLIHNTPFIENLTINGAARITNVRAERASDGQTAESNGNITYKVGFNWTVVEPLRFRGSYGTSFRAPALFEQFLANETGFASQASIDPCANIANRLQQGTISQRVADNCRAQGVPDNYQPAGSSAIVTRTGGLGFLEPEDSTAWTIGFVFTPEMWSDARFSLAVDFYDIEVTGQITTLGGGNIVSGCYNSEFFPTDPLCQLFVREQDPNNPRDNQILTVQNSFLNINSQHNRGVDVTARYIHDLGNLGTITALGQMTWTIEDEFELFAGTQGDDNGEAGDPQWVGDFNVTWRKQPFTLVYGLDAIGGTSDVEDLRRDRGDTLCLNSAFRPGSPVCPDVRLSPTFYHSLSMTVGVNENYEFSFGVANLFDTAPPRASTVFSGISALGQAPVFATQYDYFGRRFFASARARF